MYFKIVTRVALVSMAVALAGCAWATAKPGSTSTTTAVAQPTPTVELADGATYTLTAAPIEKTIGDQKIAMIAYNGSVPGPILKVAQGSTVTIKFVNHEAKSDSVHFHGIRMANAFDGVPGVTQKEVKPGESFTYTLTFPDDGVYMYHPHMRTNMGIEAGLYGNVIVTPKDAMAYAQANREMPLFLDDILIEDGKLPGNAAYDTASYALMGRFGNTMLINGKTEEMISVQTGEVVRFYFSNIANTRTFNVTLPGAQLKLVAGDDSRYEKETIVKNLILSPGERAIVDAYFPTSGSYTLTHMTPEKTYTLANITVGSEPVATSYVKEFAVLRTNADVVATLVPFRALADAAPAQTIRLSLAMQGMGNMGAMQGMDHGAMMGGDSPMAAMHESTKTSADEAAEIEWEDTMGPMNAVSTSKMAGWQIIDDATKKTNLEIDDWKFRQGDRVKIRIVNDGNSMHPMQHPVHFHGNRFVVLAVNGAPVDNLVWKDTVLVPSGGTVDIVLDASNPGTWITHCHILEHAESGMVMTYVVDGPVVSTAVTTKAILEAGLHATIKSHYAGGLYTKF